MPNSSSISGMSRSSGTSLGFPRCPVASELFREVSQLLGGQPLQALLGGKPLQALLERDLIDPLQTLFEKLLEQALDGFAKGRVRHDPALGEFTRV